MKRDLDETVEKTKNGQRETPDTDRLSWKKKISKERNIDQHKINKEFELFYS